MIRLLVCGDRNWKDYELIRSTLALIGRKRIEIVIHGACRGADMLADRAATILRIKIKPFYARWQEYGLSAGPKRNALMLKVGKPTHVLAFHDNIKKSKGTANMLKQARGKKVPTHVISHLHPHIPPNFFPL